MDIKNYLEQVVRVKVKKFENFEENIAHMMYGINSELLDELQRATSQENEKEEFGDGEFFIVGLMDFLEIEINEPSLYKERGTIPKTRINEEYLDLLKELGVINSLMKKHLVSKVYKYEDTIYTKEQLSLQLNYFYQKYITFVELVYGYSILEIREINAKKLNVRYKEGYTSEEDINRNVNIEAEILK